jgi:hypothetical protein
LAVERAAALTVPDAAQFSFISHETETLKKRYSWRHSSGTALIR